MRQRLCRVEDLFVLPYGSTVPADAWKAIQDYLHQGGNLLIVGGQPLRVRVTETNGKLVEADPQDTYSRVIDFPSYIRSSGSRRCSFRVETRIRSCNAARIHARKFFAVEGRLDGLGHLVESSGMLVAAPVILWQITGLVQCAAAVWWRSISIRNLVTGKARIGIALVRQSAIYASQGATEFSVEILFSALRPGESPVITVHLRNPDHERLSLSTSGEVKLTLSSDKEVLDSATLPIADQGIADVVAPFHQALPPGFYKISATYSSGGRLREFYQNGFWVEDTKALNAGPVLGVHGDFLTDDGEPFFPVGTNYFSTEENGWDFSGPRNAWVWEKDFAEMSRHGVSFVRTGVWMPNAKFIEANTGGVDERFLRNLEAFLLCAQRHKIAVNFTFFAFSPHSGRRPRRCRTRIRAESLHRPRTLSKRSRPTCARWSIASKMCRGSHRT